MRNYYIKVCCYDHVECWKSRKLAKEFYLSAMEGSDGFESERYAHIYSDLCRNKRICTDGISDYDECVFYDRWLKLANGTSIRDLDGTISYPKR